MSSKKDRQHRPTERTSTRPASAKASGLRRPDSPLRFLLGFAGLLTLFQLFFVIVLAPSEFFAAYMRFNAYVSSVILGWLGNDVQAVGDMLVAGSSSLGIKRGCDAIQPCGIFAGAVLAFPGPLRSKLLAIAVACPLLLLVNLLRIISLYYAYTRLPNAFELLHEAVWPAAFIALAFLLWFVWIQRLNRYQTPPP